MKKILAFFIVFNAFSNLSADPVTDFCHKNNIVSKSILLAVMPNDCAGCILPVDELIEKIRSVNNTIPIYIISDEVLSDMEKLLFKNKLGVGAFNVQFIGDETTYRYLTSKNDGIRSMCCVSETSEMLCLTNLKDGNLKPFFKYIAPALEMYISKTVELRSNYISSKNGGECYARIKDNSYVFYRQFNLISQFNGVGENTNNVFFDSLTIDYLKLAKTLFSGAEYESSYTYYQSAKKKTLSRFIDPVTMVKLGGDTLALAVDVSSFKDTVYKKQSGTLQRHQSCLLLFNSGLKYIGCLKFNAVNADKIVLHAQGLYTDGSVFFLKYNAATDKDDLAQYKIVADSLRFVSQVQEPYRSTNSDYLQMIGTYNVNRNCVFITYNSKKGNTRIYKYNTQSREFTKVAQAKNEGIYSVNETNKGNYIGINYKHGDIIPVGYQSNTASVVTCKEQSATKDNTAYSGSFLLMTGNKLVEVSYKE